MEIEKILQRGVADALKALYDAGIDADTIQIQETRKDFGVSSKVYIPCY